MLEVDVAETKSVGGIRLRRDPAREPCFTVVHRHKDMADYADMSASRVASACTSTCTTRCRISRSSPSRWPTFPTRRGSCGWSSRDSAGTRRAHDGFSDRRLRGDRRPQGRVPGHELRVGRERHDGLARRRGSRCRTAPSRAARWICCASSCACGVTQATENRGLMDTMLADEIQHVRYANRWLKADGARRILGCSCSRQGIRHSREGDDRAGTGGR